MRRAQRQHHGDLRALFLGRLDDELQCLTGVRAAFDPTIVPPDDDAR